MEAHAERVLKGAKIALGDAAKVNLHMHTLTLRPNQAADG